MSKPPATGEKFPTQKNSVVASSPQANGHWMAGPRNSAGSLGPVKNRDMMIRVFTTRTSRRGSNWLGNIRGLNPHPSLRRGDVHRAARLRSGEAANGPRHGRLGKRIMEALGCRPCAACCGLSVDREAERVAELYLKFRGSRHDGNPSGL